MNAGQPESVGENKRRHRLAWRIGLLYTVLAMINIVFFSIMIFENQTDLLQNNFRYLSDSVVKTIFDELAEVPLHREDTENFERLRSNLAAYDVERITVFDLDGNVWHTHPIEPAGSTTQVDERLLRRANEMANQELVFRSRYSTELNEQDFTVDLIIPSESDIDQAFVAATISIAPMRDRLNALYYQMGIAVVWGVIFHVLFGLFVYRTIFRRLNTLDSASVRMAQGELGARADWKRPPAGGDELDELGDRFNAMADNIQTKIETISKQNTIIEKLNRDMQTELMIGQEVQESFSTIEEGLERYRPAIFHEPLREVSGDIYHFYKFSRSRHGLFFADATGHGVSAALITALTSFSLEACLKESQEPAKVMTKLNNMIAARLNPFFNATAIFLVFQKNGRISYSNAGHTPCLIVRPSTGERFELNASGTPLGMVEDMEIHGARLDTQSGDKVLVYSDGWTEALNGQGELYGRERAFEVFAENVQESPERILEIIRTDLYAHTEVFEDDVSIIVLEIP